MDNFRTRGRWRDAGFWHHFGHGERDDARSQEDTIEKEETNKIVCQDDEFVYRGANPRTGIVSPFVFGEGTGNLWQDLGKPAGKTGQDRVKDGLGYRRVANVPLIPTTQPTVFRYINSNPKSTRDEKIQENPSNLTDVTKAQDEVGMRTPITNLPPPPTELQHIRRKKVGSGQVPKGASTNSRSCENLQDSATKVSKKVSTSDMSVFGTSIISSVERRSGPLMAEADHVNGDLNKAATIPNSITASAASNANSAVSKKYITRLHFLQSALNASQPISYHRSGQYLAKSPRSINPGGNRRNSDNASSADNLCKPWKPEQRPQVYRKFGTTSVPTVESYESELEEGYKYILSLATQEIESITEKSTKLDRINANLQPFNREQCYMPKLGRERAKVSATRSRPNRQWIDLQSEDPSKPINLTAHKSSFSIPTDVNYTQSPKDGPVCPNSNIYAGKNTERDVLRMRARSRPEKLGKTLSRPMPETGFAFNLEDPDKDWLVGLHPDTAGDKADTSCAKFIERKHVELSYPNHIAQRLVEFLELFKGAGGPFTTLVRIEYVSEWLLHMIRHTISTLHHSSPAMRAIGNSDPMISEYIGAMISVLLAVFYLLLLLNILIALCKIVMLMGKTLWLLWVPTRVVVLLLKWCIFS